MDPALLELLRCPLTGGRLHLAESDLVSRVNERIKAGDLQSRDGEPINEPLDSGLIEESSRWLYPCRDGIPTLLIEEAISLQDL